jgi:hypothetical protein
MKYFIILSLIILAWCPWLKAEEALEIVDSKILEMKEENLDLCQISVNKKSINKVTFGYTEEYSYDCGVTDSVYGVKQSRGVAFITFYKGLVGLPVEIVKKSP